jgi:hypothetical protein
MADHYWWLSLDTVYDVDSITQYTSYMNGNAPCYTGSHNERCSLRKLKVPGYRSAGLTTFDI